MKFQEAGGNYVMIKFKYSQADKIKGDEMGGACRAYGVDKNAYKIVVGNPVRKKPFGTPRCGWEYNTKIDLGGGGGKGYMVWIRFIWLMMVPMADSCEHRNEPSGFIKGGEFFD
jgi:hypothetical protein